ncbi:MAG: hypothetical protein AABZ74_10825 [Cyanobacteriota bacterium]
MNTREVLGYSVYLKKESDAEKFFNSIPKSFDVEYNKKEKEITIIGCDKLYKEDYNYVFQKGEEFAEIEPVKVEFIQTLFVRN